MLQIQSYEKLKIKIAVAVNSLESFLKLLTPSCPSKSIFRSEQKSALE